MTASYEVRVPFAGSIGFTIEADDEDDAKEQALELAYQANMDITNLDFIQADTWEVEVVAAISQGNFWLVDAPYEVEVEWLEDLDEEE